MHARYATGVFLLAAIFNVGIGTMAFLAPAVTTWLMGVTLPERPLFMQLAMWMVLVLGVGYGLTARRPEQNRDLMLVGAAGKLLVLPLMLSAWGRGDAGLVGVAAGAFDGIFALLFLDVWRRTSPARAAG